MTPLFAKPNIYLFFQSAQRTIANRPGPPQDTQRIEGTSGPAGEALEVALRREAPLRADGKNAKVLKQEIRRGRESIIRRPNASRGLRAAPRSAASRDSHVPESNSRPCAGQAGSVPMSKIPSPARPCLARGGPGFIPSATKEDKRK
ncbi:PREDICTED: uncharacterized protein LOC102019709 isoform X3 [Chinchilla lanigera]|uniref:uncharacterized protein LOC102019709 isoform X3 n=1 Tax=Chinchilla lanigera TaxID=34839 RepID=UPI0006989A0F|nr:PREDICTED: uncharacterized protein LOC102019709 isoform X3 [Chinchilla lanigera]